MTLSVSLTGPETSGNSEAELSFSVLKKLKTYLRNHMDQKRFSGFALFAVHNETKVEIDSVIKMVSPPVGGRPI